MPLSPAQAALARWLAIVPAAALSWLLGLAAGLGLLALAERLCPPEAMVSGACTAPWYEPAAAAILCASTALSAALMVGSAARRASGWPAGARGSRRKIAGPFRARRGPSANPQATGTP